MAEFFVRNSLNLNKAVRFNISIVQVTTKADYDGEPKYILEIGTTCSGINPNINNTAYVHGTGGVEDLDALIQNTIATICANIDWSILEEDKYPPYVTEQYPEGPNTSIWSTVRVTLEDPVPAAGIDLSDMQVYISNGTTEFDVTPDVVVSGDAFKYTLRWNPSYRIRNTYNGA